MRIIVNTIIILTTLILGLRAVAVEPDRIPVSFNDKGKAVLPKGYKYISEESDGCFTAKHDDIYTTYTREGFPLGSSKDGWHYLEKVVYYGADKYYQIAQPNQWRLLYNSTGKLIYSSHPDRFILSFKEIGGKNFFQIYNKFLGESYIILPDGTQTLTSQYIDATDTDKGLRFILKDMHGNPHRGAVADINGNILIPLGKNVPDLKTIAGRNYFSLWRKHPLSENGNDECFQMFDADGKPLPDPLMDTSSYIELDGHPFFILRKYSKGFGGKLEKGSCYVYSPDFDIDMPWTDADKSLAIADGKLVKTAADGGSASCVLVGLPKATATDAKPSASDVAATPSTQPAATPDNVDTDIPSGSIVRDNTFVLIIANENYQEVAPVPHALNDGEVFAKYCVNTLGIPQKNIRHLSDATLNQMRRQLTWLKDVAEAYGSEASVTVYYSGHGIPAENDGEAYLLPVDGYTSDISSNYPLKDIYTTLSALPSSNVTLILDACFTGALRGDGMMMTAKGVAIKPKQSLPQGKLVVLAAAQGDQTAYPYDSKRHGALTYFILKKLQSTRGDITLGELSQYVTSEVKRWSLVEKSKLQQPTIQVSPTLSSSWQTIKF